MRSVKTLLFLQGHIAKRFGDLVRDIWSGDAKTIAPIKLRWTVGKYRPNFASFQQQDSQELLVFLLDGLHEVRYEDIDWRVRGMGGEGRGWVGHSNNCSMHWGRSILMPCL